MLGAQGTTFLDKGDWQFTLGFRHFKSFRHFVGVEEQPQRKDMANQVINDVDMIDLAFTYGLNKRDTLTFALPYLVAQRSQAVAALGGTRNITHANGIGDFTLTYRRLMFDPDRYLDGNLRLGFGIKLPTGKPNEVDTFRFFNTETMEEDQEVRTVDQSIQPGDGGLGFLLDLSAFKQFGAFTPFVSGSYLFNPETDSGVRTYRSRESEAVMSIADQYVGQLGVQWAVPGLENLSLGLAGRIEGVPVYDVFGSSTGFRRPGYMVSVEPMLGYVTGGNVFSLSVPIAVQRNRQQSVPDKMDNRHGDAAFPDWVLLFSWTRRL